MSAVHRFVTKHPVSIYFALTFAISSAGVPNRRRSHWSTARRLPDFRESDGFFLAREDGMKLGAIAVDYDGTIAIGDRLDPAARDAIGTARRQAIAVILVTGRRLSDLQRVAGDLSCFDAVVCENGAVLEFPANGRHVCIAHGPAPSFTEELTRRGVSHVAGEVIIETEAANAQAVVEAVHQLQLPLVLAFNRSRLMVLPSGATKSRGLHHALRALRLSIHNTVGIGDAENDHDLLDACEVGVAVSWGSAALRAVADEVIQGSGPPDVADYIRRIVRQPRLSAAQMGRRRLLLGHQHNGEPVHLAVRGRTILIAGEPGTGKSWLAGLLCEQLILQGYSMCIIDPEGDYQSLDGLPGVVTLGGEDPAPSGRDLIRALRHPGISVIVDLSRMPHHRRREYLRSLLPLLNSLRRTTGLPHKILVDEAHYCLDAGNAQLIDRELAGYILVTYRISALDPAIREANDAVVMVTRETDADEAETLNRLCRPQPCKTIGAETFRDLGTNEIVLLPGSAESLGCARHILMAPRLTSHVRHRAKYLDMPVLDDQAFVFRTGGRIGPRARTLKEFMATLAALPGEQIRGHLLRHDFSRWLEGVFRDHGLAGRVYALEAGTGTRDPREIAGDVAQAIHARYDTAPGLVAAL